MSPTRFGLLLALFSGTACGTLHPPLSPGDLQSAPAYGYTPVDALAAIPSGDVSCGVPSSRLLLSLPDETMRLAIGTVTDSGYIRYGPAKVGTSGNSYVVVLDYTQSQTIPMKLGVVNSGQPDSTFRVLSAGEVPTSSSSVVPVYVGVGLRLTANVTVRKASVDLGNLVAIGAAAQAGVITGTMVVQTLGISGSQISALLPMPSDVSASTIQNAIQSLGSIKTKIYDGDTQIQVRVVGFYNNLGNGSNTTGRFISSALTQPLGFPIPPCEHAPAH